MMKNSSLFSEVEGRMNSTTSFCERMRRNLCQLIEALLQNRRIVFLENGAGRVKIEYLNLGPVRKCTGLFLPVNHIRHEMGKLIIPGSSHNADCVIGDLGRSIEVLPFDNIINCLLLLAMVY